jgi:16S rRNA (guanine527-N7)-methyltransferase
LSVFGERLELACRFAAILAEAGTVQGLLGPREVPRLWDRHLLNCAVVAELIPKPSEPARVIDVGSGAGLPGIAMAISRPDLRLELVEPMDRRIRFLTETVTALGLRDSVRITQGRAPDVASTIKPAPWVVARAVAPLERLVPQCLPLVLPEGHLLAMKGTRAEQELAALRSTGKRVEIAESEVREVGSNVLAEPTRVVVFRRGSARGSKGKR